MFLSHLPPSAFPTWRCSLCISPAVPCAPTTRLPLLLTRFLNHQPLEISSLAACPQKDYVAPAQITGSSTLLKAQNWTVEGKGNVGHRLPTFSVVIFGCATYGPKRTSTDWLLLRREPGFARWCVCLARSDPTVSGPARGFDSFPGISRMEMQTGHSWGEGSSGSLRLEVSWEAEGTVGAGDGEARAALGQRAWVPRR